MSDEDLASVVVFLRSLPSVRSELPPTKIPFLFARLIQAAPQPVTEPLPEPDPAAPAKHGAHLAKLGTYSDCHTPLNPKFQPVPDMEMAGGSPMVRWAGVASTNTTPDASGIVYCNEALFIQTIRTGSVDARTLKPVMPWWVSMAPVVCHQRKLILPHPRRPQNKPLALLPQIHFENPDLAHDAAGRTNATGSREDQIAAKAFKSFTPSGTPQPLTASKPGPAL